LWVIGLPLVALWMLFRNGKYLEKIERNDLNKQEISKIERIARSYRFIYSGYKADYFYWETIIVFRKIFMIAAGVFL
jgi:hypothetical protein